MILARILPIAIVLALLAGCDGGPPTTSAPPPPPPSPPVGNRAPIAQFAAPAAVVAGQPLAFDGSASVDPDGDAISLHWDFGDGLRGGGGRLAHVFESAGSYPVTLTAIDPAGSIGSLSQTITVAAAPAPARTQTVSGRVTALDGGSLAGVSVRAFAATGVTDSEGRLSLDLGIGAPQTLRFSRSGYVDQIQTLNFPESGGGDASFTVAMRASEPAQTLPDAAAGGTLSGRDGARITLPAGALVTAAGTPVSGPVQIAMTPIDITQPNAGGFPGQFAGVDADAVTQMIVSYGTTDFVLSQDGQRLQLAPGRPAEILLPLYATQVLGGAAIALGERMPLWSLSETSGLWVQEGEGEVVAAAAAPTGLALRATVSHFSPWNADRVGVPRSPDVRGRCVYDDDIGVPGARDHFATATLCNWLAEMDRGIPPQGASQGTSGGTSGGASRGAPARAPARFGSQAEPLPPPLPGFAASGPVPVGGDLLLLPANAPIRFTVSALNGAFTGSATLAADSNASEVVVKMRPIASDGGDAEAVSLPFEAERRFETDQVRSFAFAGTGFRWLRVTLTPTGDSSPLRGEIRLFRGSTGLASAIQLQPGLVTLLPGDADDYRVEIVPTGNTPASVRLRLEQVGSTVSETPALPLLIRDRPLPALTVLSQNLNAETARSLLLSLRVEGGSAADEPAQWRLRDAAGNELFNSRFEESRSGVAGELSQPLPAAGTYRLDIASLGGDGCFLSLGAELSPWTPQGAVLDGRNLVDLVADRDGRPVLLLSRRYTEGGVIRHALSLQRWTGSQWQAVGPELGGLFDRGNGFGEIVPVIASVAFDSSNRPLLGTIEGVTSGSSNIRVSARRLEGTAWQGLGASQGLLYEGSSASRAVDVQLRLDGAGRPIAALVRPGDFNSRVQVSRYENDAWTGLVATVAAGDLFDGNLFDLQVDAQGRPLLVYGSQASGAGNLVRRFEGTPGGWLPLGGDDGRLPPPAGRSGSFSPLLRFDGSGQPLVAGGNGSTVAVWRYDGAVWNTGAAYRTALDHFALTLDSLAWFGDAAQLAWINQEGVASGATTRPVVQSSDAADRYLALGPYQGAVPPFHPHDLITRNGRQQRLLVTDGALYQAIEAYSANGGTSLDQVSLLRLTP